MITVFMMNDLGHQAIFLMRIDGLNEKGTNCHNKIVYLSPSALQTVLELFHLDAQRVRGKIGGFLKSARFLCCK